MALDRPSVIAYGEAMGLARLRRHVAHVDLERITGTDGSGNVIYQQIGHHTGEKTARSHNNQISVENSTQRWRISV